MEKSGSGVIDPTIGHILFARCSMPEFAAMEARTELTSLPRDRSHKTPRGISGWEAAQALSGGGPEHRKSTGRRYWNRTREIMASAHYCLRPMAPFGSECRRVAEGRDCSSW